MFKNRILRRMPGTKGEEVRDRRRKLHRAPTTVYILHLILLR
jgi:hypothetical protein